MTSASELAEMIRDENITYPGLRVKDDSVQVYDGGDVNLFIREAGRVTEWDVEGDVGGLSINKHFENSREVIAWLKEQFN